MEPRRQTNKLVQSGIGFAPLDTAQVPSGHPDLVGEVLLADTDRLAKLSELQPEGPPVRIIGRPRLPARYLHQYTVQVTLPSGPRYI